MHRDINDEILAIKVGEIQGGATSWGGSGGIVVVASTRVHAGMFEKPKSW